MWKLDSLNCLMDNTHEHVYMLYLFCGIFIDQNLVSQLVVQWASAFCILISDIPQILVVVLFAHFLTLRKDKQAYESTVLLVYMCPCILVSAFKPLNTLPLNFIWILYLLPFAFLHTPVTTWKTWNSSAQLKHRNNFVCLLLLLDHT